MLCIETKDLRKKYASTIAVDGVDLQIESGQVFGFLSIFHIIPYFSSDFSAERVGS